jgi:hypothetical protein
MQTQLLSRAGLCADVAGAEGAHPEDAAGGRADDAHVRRRHQRRGRPEGSPRGRRASGTQQGAMKAQTLSLDLKAAQVGVALLAPSKAPCSLQLEA